MAKRQMRKTRKTRKRQTQRKTRKTSQQGGFYPTVFEGVRNASMLIPLAARQAYNMWKSVRTTKRRKHLRPFA